MQPKEILFVAIGAIVLTNVSIVGTLFATGHFGDADSDALASQQDSEKAAEEVAEPDPETQELPPEANPKPVLHSMSDAMYVCEEKVISSNSGKRFAYQVDTVASRFSETTQLYGIFINTKTASSENAPQESASVFCEVDAKTMAVTNYKAMKN